MTSTKLPANDRAVPDLWRDWERVHKELIQVYDEIEAAAEAVPQWAHNITQKIATFEMALLTKDLAQWVYDESRERIAKLETSEYRRARADLDAAEKHERDVCEAGRLLEIRIAETPARTVPEVLIKLGLANTLTRVQLGLGGGVFDDDQLENSDRLVFSAHADLERLTA